MYRDFMYFKYDDIEDVFEIIDYNTDTMEVTIYTKKYGEYSLSTDALHDVNLGSYLGRFRKKYKYNIGDVVNEITIVALTKTGKQNLKAYRLLNQNVSH